MQPKGRRPPTDTSGVMYRVNCLDCPSNYHGMTEKRRCTRMHEHALVVKRQDVRSHVTMRSLENNHRFNFDGVQVLGQAGSRLAREFIEVWQSDARQRRPTSALRDRQAPLAQDKRTNAKRG
ncbi:unnamed protein product [Schistocephalus solidus]|uniref:Uncharacterized protein n=1 Tax=Schistocephalus solidus TaxID=70667 RepID=A0A183TKP9_SCHSO|nr:unnamed protein product [Schistocephalus solidus]